MLPYGFLSAWLSCRRLNVGSAWPPRSPSPGTTPCRTSMDSTSTFPSPDATPTGRSPRRRPRACGEHCASSTAGATTSPKGDRSHESARPPWMTRPPPTRTGSRPKNSRLDADQDRRAAHRRGARLREVVLRRVAADRERWARRRPRSRPRRTRSRVLPVKVRARLGADPTPRAATCGSRLGRDGCGRRYAMRLCCGANLSGHGGYSCPDRPDAGLASIGLAACSPSAAVDTAHDRTSYPRQGDAP